MQTLPNKVGYIKTESLEGKNNRHPLVVSDLSLKRYYQTTKVLSNLVSFLSLARDFLVEGNEEGVLNETVVLSVLFPASFELHWHPALDRTAHISENKKQFKTLVHCFKFCFIGPKRLYRCSVYHCLEWLDNYAIADVRTHQ